jgi:hypothetical protein
MLSRVKIEKFYNFGISGNEGPVKDPELTDGKRKTETLAGATRHDCSGSLSGFKAANIGLTGIFKNWEYQT